MTQHRNFPSGLLAAAITGALVFGTPAAQAVEPEFHVGVFTDYLDDGASKSDNDPVVQGGLELGFATGVFTGVEASTLGSGNGTEVTPFVGYGFDAGPVGIEFGYEYAHYTSLDDADEGEVFLGADWQMLSAEVAYVAHADDRDAEGSRVWSLGAEHEVAPRTELFGTLGYDDPADDNGATFWELGAAHATDFGTFSLTYASRDESGAQNLLVGGYRYAF
ncbi:TorF family putative porin [Thioalkalivibrio sp. ALE11]|uniref:TorF family putative porin n=1 Tax=Thioalkalivibrio sp. ALE11 TaxID=1265494 RepID=UPI000376B110|nr:TorF family putative porin [Thioalkalivibrio sp. ALE11]